MTARKKNFLAALPFCAAFVVAPLAVPAAKLADHPALAQSLGPQGLGLWLGLAGLAALLGVGGTFRSASVSEKTRGLWWRALLGVVLAAAAALAARSLGPALAQAVDLAPALDELRLPALIVFAGLWVWSFGAPKPALVAGLGAILGAMTLLDFLLTAILARRLVLGGGYLFGSAASMADVLAFLLCLAYCATLARPKPQEADAVPATVGSVCDGSDRGEADRGGTPSAATAPGGGKLTRWLILTGLLATFSRAGLAAAAIICLSHDPAPLRKRLSIAAACVVAIWMTLALPLPRIPGPGEELGLSWYWVATTEAMRQDPHALLFGLPLATPMALAMPDVPESELIPGLDGLPVSVFQIPVSLLRLAAAWGLAAPLALLAGAFWCVWRSRSRYGLALFTALLVCSGLGPVLHVPASAAAASLAFFAAASAGAAAQKEEAA